MNYAILYNVFACWAVSLMGVLIGRQILTLDDTDPADHAYGLFWLSAGVLWFTSGMRLLMLFRGDHILDLMLFYVVQIILALHLVFGVFYCSYKISKGLRFSFVASGIAALASGIAALLGLLFLFFMFNDGVTKTVTTIWASEHEIPARAFMMFLPVYLFCVLGTCYMLTVNTMKYFLRGKTEHAGILPFVALLLYEAAGIFDAKGIVSNHNLLLIRSMYMVSAIMAFLSYAWDSSAITIIQEPQPEKK